MGGKAEPYFRVRGNSNQWSGEMVMIPVLAFVGTLQKHQASALVLPGDMRSTSLGRSQFHSALLIVAGPGRLLMSALVTAHPSFISSRPLPLAASVHARKLVEGREAPLHVSKGRKWCGA